MGGGGGGDQEVFQTNIPKWAEGAHRELISHAQREAYDRPFPVYGDQRISGFSPYEEAAFGAQQQMFERGDPLGEYAARQITAPGYQAAEFDFGEFDQSQLDKYMSPFMQNVVESEKRAARDEYARQQNRTQAERVSSGAMGGYRESVEEGVRGAQQGQVLADIQARGSQRAFENAQQQYQRDREALIQAAEMGDRSAYNAAAFRLQQAEYANQLATAGQTRAQERITGLERAGMTQRGMQQAELDLAYEDFMREYQFPKTQMSWLSGILGGIPSGMQQYTRSPGPGLGSQALGYGLGAYGLSQMFQQGQV